MSSLSRWWASGWSDNKSTKTKFSRLSLGNVSSINVKLTQGPFTNHIHSTDWIGSIYLAKEVVMPCAEYGCPANPRTNDSLIDHWREKNINK